MPTDPLVPESIDVTVPTDAELLKAVKAGDVDALGVLYDRYARLVYGLAFKILENSEESEDVTQEIFLMLWHRNTYDPDRSSLSSFLMLVTRSRSIDKLRSRSTRFKFLQRWQQMARNEPSPANLLEQVSMQERSQRVREAMARLPEAERQVLEIAYYEGLSQSEIAQKLNTPLGTVKTRSRQGLLKLRQALQNYI